MADDSFERGGGNLQHNRVLLEPGGASVAGDSFSVAKNVHQRGGEYQSAKWRRLISKVVDTYQAE